MWGIFQGKNNNNIAETYQALVKAFIPVENNSLIEDMGNQLIWILDHRVSIQLGLSLMTIPLSVATAQLLDVGARQLIAKNKAMGLQQLPTNEGGSFASLSHEDRFRALAFIEQLDIDLRSLPAPYRNNTGLVEFMIDSINRFVIFGYYSEWSGYGSTKFDIPDERKLEQFPVSWKEVGYPGPALGYRDHRGYLL
jgi:hypothetical protein